MSKIQWTEATWNPIVGCSMVSDGCTNCYAMREAWRQVKQYNSEKYRGLARISGGVPKWTGEVRLWEDALNVPLKRKIPTIYFVNSMGDLFHEKISQQDIQRVLDVTCQAPRHIYQILTKRSERLKKLRSELRCEWHSVWWGVSVENKATLHRIKDLSVSDTARVKFLSIEPLLEDLGDINLRAIDWVIVGGESGLGCRPMQKAWVENIRVQCEEQGVAFFFKQWGGRSADKGGRLLNGRTYDDMPEGYAMPAEAML